MKQNNVVQNSLEKETLLSSTRRGFLAKAAKIAAAILGMSLSLPVIGNGISPVLNRRKPFWMWVGTVKDLPVEVPKNLEYAITVKDGPLEEKKTKTVWALKHQDGTVTVFSPRCPHLGCGYRWDSRDRQFKCPCHGSVFDVNGQVLRGPAPRPLDHLPSKIQNGELLVMYEEFKSGLTTQVEL